MKLYSKPTIYLQNIGREVKPESRGGHYLRTISRFPEHPIFSYLRGMWESGMFLFQFKSDVVLLMKNPLR